MARELTGVCLCLWVYAAHKKNIVRYGQMSIRHAPNVGTRMHAFKKYNEIEWHDIEGFDSSRIFHIFQLDANDPPYIFIHYARSCAHVLVLYVGFVHTAPHIHTHTYSAGTHTDHVNIVCNILMRKIIVRFSETRRPCLGQVWAKRHRRKKRKKRHTHTHAALQDIKWIVNLITLTVHANRPLRAAAALREIFFVQFSIVFRCCGGRCGVV